MIKPMEIARSLGALRLMLIACTLVVIALGPFSGGPSGRAGMPLVLNVLAPTLFATLLFVFPLDVTMSLVFMNDKTGEERRRFRTIVTVEVLVFAALVLAWLPLLLKLIARA